MTAEVPIVIGGGIFGIMPIPLQVGAESDVAD